MGILNKIFNKLVDKNKSNNKYYINTDNDVDELLKESNVSKETLDNLSDNKGEEDD